MSVYESLQVYGLEEDDAPRLLTRAGCWHVKDKIWACPTEGDPVHFYLTGEELSFSTGFLSYNHGFIPIQVFQAIAALGARWRNAVYLIEHDLLWEGGKLQLREELKTTDHWPWEGLCCP